MGERGGGTALIARFVRVADELASDDGYNAMKMMVQENERLRIEDEDHRKGYEAILKELSNAYSDREELRARTEEQREKISALTSLQSELASARKERDAAVKDLKDLKRFFKPLKTETTESCATKCAAMQSQAWTLILNFFAHDLEDATRADDAVWKSLSMHPYLGTLPIPASNSPIARQMRASALLALLGHALHEHIFLPTHLLRSGGTDLRAALSDLICESSEQESFVRSALHAILPEDRQAENAKIAAELVVKQVSEYADSLMPLPASKTNFRASLKKTCLAIQKQWMDLQRSDPKIEASLSYFAEEDQDEWVAVQFDSLPKPTSNGSNGSKKSHSSDTKGKTKADGTAKAAALPPRTPGKINYSDIHCVLWPSFSAVRQDTEEVVAKGVVLLKSQIQDANNECMGQQHLPQARQLTRRERRKSERTNGHDAAKGGFLGPESGGKGSGDS